LIRSDSGKFVLEAALLFPFVVTATVALVFLGLFAGVQSTALSAAGLAADRAAFAWDNSHKNPVTGSFLPGQYDGLYWRLTDDFPSSALSIRKMEAALATIGAFAGKESRYENAVWRRKVSVEATAAFAAPDVLPAIGRVERTLQRSEAIVTDPVEWVRTVDTVRLYWPMVERFITPQEAERMVEEFRLRPGAGREAPAFRNHEEAVEYLQQLVGGAYKRIDTEEVGEYRRIEAYDRHGVAHHAYLGTKNISDVRDQLLKDEELLGKGLVKGVVWHFFRRADTGAIGPSDKLRKELEKRGIVIVIHE
jgi:hypothetical protein